MAITKHELESRIAMLKINYFIEVPDGELITPEGEEIYSKIKEYEQQLKSYSDIRQ